jgi:hypothetical protein
MAMDGSSYILLRSKGRREEKPKTKAARMAGEKETLSMLQLEEA